MMGPMGMGMGGFPMGGMGGFPMGMGGFGPYAAAGDMGGNYRR